MSGEAAGGRRYALNSAVLTAPGTYTYRIVTPEEARDWWHEGPVHSTIGYPETCEAMRAILRVDVPVNREVVRMEPGDCALVFRIALPKGERRLSVGRKGAQGQAFLLRHCEIGLLTRAA